MRFNLLSFVGAMTLMGLLGCGHKPPPVTPGPPDVLKVEALPDGAPKEAKSGLPSSVEEKAGQLSTDLLTPASRFGDVPGDRGKPIAENTQAFPAPPEISLAPIQLDVRPPEKEPFDLKSSLPPSLPEEVPFGRLAADPARPGRFEFPPVRIARVETPIWNEIAPFPSLARPVPDRTPLADASLEASLAAALKGPAPQRTMPAPFVRPANPAEAAEAMRLRRPIPESNMPPLGTARFVNK